MEKKSVFVEVPEGYNTLPDFVEKDGKIEIFFERKNSSSWNEFCDKNPVNSNGVWEAHIGESSDIEYSTGERIRFTHCDRNQVPSRYVKAFQALGQLLTIREHEYLTAKERNTSDLYWENRFSLLNKIENFPTKGRVLTFPSLELRDRFYENWKDLIEIAAPLL